jgi:hypothetical protein
MASRLSEIAFSSPSERRLPDRLLDACAADRAR